MSTGAVGFGPKQAPSGGQEPLNMVVLGDFSGAGNNSETLRAVTIDRDNFDDVFAKIAPALTIPGTEDLLTFTELDQLHPDFLYRESALFAHLRRLKSGLKNPAKVERVSQEILSWSDAEKLPAEAATSKDTANASEQGITMSLDSLLERNSQNVTAANDIGAFIKSVVAPHLSAKATPQQNQLAQTLADACSALMVEVLQWPAFKVLEANWRSLYWLTRQLETGPQLTISLIDISLPQLAALSEQANGLNKLSALLGEDPLHTAQRSYDLIVGNYQFDDDLQQLAVLGQLTDIAAANNALFISGGHERLAGCASLRQSSDSDDWNYSQHSQTEAAWSTLQQQPTFANCVLTCPRFLLRLPYGKKTAPIETFAFEEWSGINTGEHYLWGNSAHLVAAGIAQQHHSDDPLSIGGLPVHYYQIDGESEMQPCLEAALGDRARGHLRDAGLRPLALASPDRALVALAV
ncbi:MAG: type VI secretion system protein ImpC [Paraglaciecola psychrophila]|jgi:type VI secretion system protein ImpC